MPVAALEAAQANGGTNSPIVNGTTLKEQPLESFATGNVNRVPAILGVNRDEDLTGTAQTPGAYIALVNSQYGPPFGTHAAQVLKRYPLLGSRRRSLRHVRSLRTRTPCAPR